MRLLLSVPGSAAREPRALTYATTATAIIPKDQPLQHQEVQMCLWQSLTVLLTVLSSASHVCCAVLRAGVAIRSADSRASPSFFPCMQRAVWELPLKYTCNSTISPLCSVTPVVFSTCCSGHVLGKQVNLATPSGHCGQIARVPSRCSQRYESANIVFDNV